MAAAVVTTKEPRLRCSMLRCEVGGRQCLSSCVYQARISGGICPDFKSFAEMNDEQMVRFVASNLDNLNASAKFAFHDLIVRAKAFKKSGVYQPPEEKKTMSTPETATGGSVFDKLKALKPTGEENATAPAAPASEPAAANAATADDTAATQPPAAVSPAADPPPSTPPVPAAAAPVAPAPAAQSAKVKKPRQKKNEKETAMPRGVYDRTKTASATPKPKRVSTRKVAAKASAGPAVATAVPAGGSYIHTIVDGVSTLTATKPKAARQAVAAAKKLKRKHSLAVSALSKAHAHEPAVLAAKLGEVAAAQAAEVAALPTVVGVTLS